MSKIKTCLHDNMHIKKLFKNTQFLTEKKIKLLNTGFSGITVLGALFVSKACLYFEIYTKTWIF
jgi:hypothetical protein